MTTHIAKQPVPSINKGLRSSLCISETKTSIGIIHSYVVCSWWIGYGYALRGLWLRLKNYLRIWTLWEKTRNEYKKIKTTKNYLEKNFEELLGKNCFETTEKITTSSEKTQIIMNLVVTYMDRTERFWTKWNSYLYQP